MVLHNAGLLKRVNKLELKGSQCIQLTPACLSALNDLLYDVYYVQSPRPSDYDNRKELVRIFNVMASHTFGKHSEALVVQPFGSFLMDMFSAESDLDLSINFSNDTVEFSRQKKIESLQKFARLLYSLQSKGHVTAVQRIFRARVPILKVVDCGTGIECDISVENKDGISKSQIIHIIAAIDERFQKLCRLMKTWAKAHDINSSKDHTMNSISIISLVAFHLQTRNPPILPAFCDLFKDGTDPTCVMKLVHGFLGYGKRNKESLAELFHTLLTKLVLVETLWPEGLCASTYEGCWISKTWDSKAGYINIEDFTDRSQNVARSVAVEGFQKIYKCIHASLHYLTAFVEGRIEAPKLEGLFFRSEPHSTKKNDAVVNLERSFPLADPVMVPPHFNPIPEEMDAAVYFKRKFLFSDPEMLPPPSKRMRFEGVSAGEFETHGWIPWDIHDQHPPIVPLESHYRSEQAPSSPVWSGGALHISSVPPLHDGGFQQRPWSEGFQNMNPMFHGELPHVTHERPWQYNYRR